MELKVESNIKHLIHHKGYDNKRLADTEALVKMAFIFDCSLDDLVSYNSLSNTDFDREDCFSYKDLTDMGLNGSMAHGIIKQINSTKKVEDIPVMLVDNKVKLVYKTDVVELLNGLLDKVS